MLFLQLFKGEPDGIVARVNVPLRDPDGTVTHDFLDRKAINSRCPQPCPERVAETVDHKLTGQLQDRSQLTVMLVNGFYSERPYLPVEPLEGSAWKHKDGVHALPPFEHFSDARAHVQAPGRVLGLPETNLQVPFQHIHVTPRQAQRFTNSHARIQTKNSNVLKGLSSHLQVQSFLLGIQNELTWLLTRQHSDAWNTLNQFPLLGHT